ncbi:MAG: restriction endonuclease subunit S [Victivallales bacterium]|nr:restriction endonuclease subunit S [Victivallales bacterium]
MTIKPYTKYKDSSVTWLGDIPEHWGVTRTKNIFRLRTENSGSDHGLELLSIYTHIGVRPRKSLEQKGNKASTTDNYWIVKRGDLIVNKLLAWMGAIGVSHYSGVTSPAYDILRSIQDINSDYYHHLFRTKLYLQQFKAWSRGIMDMRLRLYFDEFGQIASIVPPKKEQDQITRYLDWQTSKINKFIKAKKKLITLLKEQKQNVINEAVTKGINPNVKMKDSGVEWLGEIPVHWITRRLKYISNLNKKTLTDSTDPDYLFRYVDIGSVSTGTISKNLEQLNYSNAPSRAKRVISKGDTIISTVRTYLKAIYHFEHEIKDIIASTGFAVLTPVRIFPKMLGYLLLFDGFIDQVIRLSVGASYPAINADRLCDIRVAFPEDKQEQEFIVEHIEKETALIDKTIARTEREIELIQEYRTRLVSDVVTGKVDVRFVEIPDFEPVEVELEAQDDEESEDELITEDIEE